MKKQIKIGDTVWCANGRREVVRIEEIKSRTLGTYNEYYLEGLDFAHYENGIVTKGEVLPVGTEIVYQKRRYVISAIIEAFRHDAYRCTPVKGVELEAPRDIEIGFSAEFDVTGDVLTLSKEEWDRYHVGYRSGDYPDCILDPKGEYVLPKGTRYSRLWVSAPLTSHLACNVVLK